MGIGTGKLKNGRGIYSRAKILYVHIIAWVIFITAELSTIYFIAPNLGVAMLDYASHYMVNIGLFYLNCLVVFPKTYRSKVILQIPLFIGLIFEMVCYLLVIYVLNLILLKLHIHPQPDNKLWTFVVPNAYRAFLFLVLSTGYWLGSYLLKSRIEIDGLIQQQLEDKNEQLELQKKVIVSENAFLKAQINPHFLFNSLNFIYNTVHKSSPGAAEAVILLSDITRYSLRKSDVNGQMPLHEEIEQISNLIELNQIRFNRELQIEFNVGLIKPTYTIPPLLLISFVENIFKYGKLNDPETPAEINIKELDGVLQFRTKNVIQKRKGAEGYGVGLENTQLRLNNIFPNRHKLVIAATENTYTIELDIQMSPC